MRDNGRFVQPRFRSVPALEAKIEAYFERCKGETLTDEATGAPLLDKKGRPVVIGAHPPTQTGLALALGFPTRAAMWNYRGKPAMEAALVKARSRVDQYAEERLFDREGSAGARFSLKRDESPRPEEGAVSPEVYAEVMSEARRRVWEAERKNKGGR